MENEEESPYCEECRSCGEWGCCPYCCDLCKDMFPIDIYTLIPLHKEGRYMVILRENK